MNFVCPNPIRCWNVKDNVVLHHSKENIDNIRCYHVLCSKCGFNFNQWDCSSDKLKEILGENYENYK